jgi:hypothetical protein
MKDTPEIWSPAPAHLKMRPWIEVKLLQKIYKRNGCMCM